MLPAGNSSASSASSASTTSGSKWSSFSGAFSKAKSAAGNVLGGIGNAAKSIASKAISGGRQLLYDLKNPMGSNKLTQSLYKGARVAQTLSPLAFIAAGASGMMLDEEDRSDSKLANLGNTVLSIPEQMVEYASGNGGLQGQGVVARALSDNVLNKTMFRGIGNLTFSDIKTAATKGADAVADGLTQNSKRAGAVAVENVSGLVRSFVNTLKQGLEKALNNKVIKKFLGTKIGKQIGKIVSWVGTALTKKLPDVFKRLTKKELAKATAAAATTHPYAKVASLIIFGLYDAISGALSDARVYFKVDSDDVTLGMRVASAIAKTLQGVIVQMLPYFNIGGFIGSIIVAALPTEWFATGLYKLFASDEAEAELKNKQDAYYEQYKSYMKEHYPDLDESEYEDKYSFSKWRRENDKTFMESATDVVTGALSTARKAISSAAGWVVDKVTGKGTDPTTTASGTSTSTSTKAESLSNISQIITKAVNVITGLKVVKESLGSNTSAIQTAASAAVSKMQNSMTDEALSELSAKINTNNLDANVSSAFMSGYSSAASILNINGSSLTVPLRIAAGAGKALSDLTSGAIDAAEFAGTLASQLTMTNEANKAKNDAKQAAKNANVSATAKNTSLSDRTTVSSSDTVEADTKQNKSFMQRAGEAVVNAAKSVGSWVSDKWNSFTSWITGKGHGRFGRGEYFSQTDPRWNQMDPDMKNSGCGPTVAAMMASHYGKGRWGRAATPI